MTTATVNPQREKIFGMLAGAGYHLLWDISAPNASRLECWSGRRGVVIVQAWQDAGVEVYQANGVPSDWDDLEAWLEGK